MHAQAAAGSLAMSGPPDVAVIKAGQLVRQATGGDLEAFEELVRRLQRQVYGFAFQHLRDFAEAQDLTQEIFVKLYRNLARFDSARPFEPWFWKLATNTTINYRRKRVPAPTDQDLELTAEPADQTQHDPTWSMRSRSWILPIACPSFCTTTPTCRWNRSRPALV